MSEVNLTDRISETITIAFKKSKVFEKFEIYFGSFLLITSAVGLTCVAINVITGFNVDNIKKELQDNENVLKYNIEINRKRNLIEHCSLKSEILIIHKQLSLLLETQQKMFDQIEDIKFNRLEENIPSINISKIDFVSASTSMNTFSPIKLPEITDGKEDDYDELINECYDTIPLNNLKKNTGLSWLFK